MFVSWVANYAITSQVRYIFVTSSLKDVGLKTSRHIFRRSYEAANLDVVSQVKKKVFEVVGLGADPVKMLLKTFNDVLPVGTVTVVFDETKIGGNG